MLAPGADAARARSGIVAPMHPPLVTPIDPEPTVAVLFNDRGGPDQVTAIIAAKHAFVETEAWTTVDEEGRPAWLLLVTCETATADQLFDLIGSRLPDYIQARRFPLGRVPEVRSNGSRVR